MEENQIDQELESPILQRPTGLIICLMLSVFNSILGLLSGIGLISYAGYMNSLPFQEQEALLNEQVETVSKFVPTVPREMTVDLFEKLMQYGKLLGFSGIGVSLLTIVAVFQMFRFKKIGFHLYIAARILEIGLPAMLAGSVFLSPLTVMFSICFIYFYSRFFKLMK